MGFPSIYNVPVDEDGFNIFSFENAQSHRDIDSAIFSKYNIKPTGYCVDPISPSDMVGWLMRHQQMHDVFNGALSLSGNDLTGVDFRNKEQMEIWIWLHSQEHAAANLKLGILS